MKFRNYCLVVIGDTDRIQEEISKISETTPRYLDGKGLFIATFSSALTPKELTEWFRLNKRNFLIFDLNQETCGFNINRKEIHEGLFGFLRDTNLDDKSSELLREIQLSSDTINLRQGNGLVTESASTKTILVTEKVITEKDVKKMYKSDRENLFNKLIDKGIENLSENDKTTLGLLAKY